MQDIYPSTPVQGGFLFHSLYGQDDTYFEQVRCRITGDLDASAFQRAWQTLLDRHAVLRTYFVWDGLPEPMQVVCDRVTLPWQQWDWQQYSAGEQERRWQEFLAADRRKGFALNRPPLVRFTLAQSSSCEYEFAWSHPHILLDGWSVQLLLNELFGCYAAYRRGHAPALPEVRPYRDYVAWLQRQDREIAEQFWRERLRGFSAPVEFDESFQRHDTQPQDSAERFEEEPLHVSQEASLALRDMARRCRITINSIIQGAWAVLLSRYTGQEDVLFGAVVSGRPADLAGVESIVGLFINTLPVRIQVDPRQSVAAWLSSIQQQQAEARRFEYTPLVSIRGWSELPSNVPFFESLLVFQNYPRRRESPTEGAIQPLQISRVANPAHTNYPLTLRAWFDGGLQAYLTYDGSRFGTATVRRMLQHLGRVLEEMVRDPEGRIGEVDLLGAEERQQVLVDWNRTEAEYGGGQCVHELFEEQAQERPEAVAVVYEGEEVSYGELNRRANQLAHYLRGLGVGAEVRVGICMERSVEMIVSVLGVLKAGGAYVPLDPEYPAERLSYMMEDAQVPVLLTQERLRGKLPSSWGQVISVDGEWEAIGEGREDNPGKCVAEENLVYVIYTSGSTGKPKGVGIEHRQLVNYVRAISEELKLERGARLGLVSTFAADLGNTVLYPGLCMGGELHVISAERAMEGEQLRKYVKQCGVEYIKITPSQWKLTLSGAREKVLPGKALVLGGEAWSWEWMKEWAGDGCAVVNHYGPTECTVGAIAGTVVESEEEAGEKRGTAPMGRPIRNTEAYVLGEEMEVVPVGAKGELYIGGAGVGRGYLNRPEMTAERFVPNPFREGRLYRSGDVVRWRTDGSLEFVGRKDEQVKIRGYRIEPGEVEAAIKQEAGVRDAVVVVREGEGAEKGLVGYVVMEEGRKFRNKEIRRGLQSRIPEHMIPGVLVELKEVPLTANGKVDKRKLPERVEGRGEEEEGRQARSAVEELIGGIWGEVLGVGQVGVGDNFFELGGHSLLATQVMTRVREVLGVEIELRSLFAKPKLEDFAGEVERRRQEEGGIRLGGGIERVERKGALPLSYAQQRLWFIDQLEPGSVAYNVPRAVRLKGQLDVEALRRALQEVVRRHEVLRTRYEMVEGIAQQRVELECGVGVVVEDLRAVGAEEREQEMRRRAGEEARRPFDLKRAPMLRARLLRMGEEEHVLLLTMHHIASDGWSRGVVLKEVAALYDAYVEGRPSPLEELKIQYGDYAVWQREWLKGEVLEKQLGYWREQLADLPVLELPTDHVRPRASKYRAGRGQYHLDAELTGRLRELCRSEGVTLFMVLLGALQVVLGRWAGQDDVVVGTDVANRTRGELEELIGFFVNQLVLRTSLGGNPSFREVLRRVREVCLGAYTHQDLPFEKLVEELAPERDASRNPLFQVKFLMQHFSPSSDHLAGIEPEALDIECSGTNFDLLLSVSDKVDSVNVEYLYAADLFECTTIDRMLQHWLSLLNDVVYEPAHRIDDIDTLSESERQQAIIHWNQTSQVYPEGLVQELFEHQAAKTPDAVCLLDKDSQLTYSELNRHCNQLAHYLRSLGVGPEVRVALCLRRSTDLVVAVFATLKAGAAYVPLDPDCPPDRLAYMLNDSQASVLLTEGSVQAQLPAQCSSLTIFLDAEMPQISLSCDQNPRPLHCYENAAYICYTSGSTGHPKGVVVTHRGLSNYLMWSRTAYGTTGGVAPFYSSLAFDLSVTALYLPLLSGGAIQLLPGDALEELATSMKSRPFDFIKVTPTHLAALELRLGTRDFSSAARLLIVGGEAVFYPQLANWRHRSTKMRVINEYGPTETVVGSCFYEVGTSDQSTGPVPIGRAISNTSVFVLNEALQSVPIGVAGELYIGGAGLARGYLGRPGLTAEKFVPNPFSLNLGERLYRTGDVGRWRPDGVLEFLGRTDEQVKLRGYRIELAEIEAALREHKDVADAVVLSLGDGPVQKKLIAYVRKQTGACLNIAELKRSLRQRLPTYMVPSAWVEVERIPWTPSGKVDKRALSDSVELPSACETAFVAARQPLEELLGAMWEKTLGVAPIGMEDNFFELGGHSLLAIQLTSEIRSVFGIEVEVRQVFDRPILSALCEVVEQKLRHNEKTQVPLPMKAERKGALPLSYAQQRLWFIDQLEPGSVAYNVPGAVRLKGQLDVEALRRALQEVVRRHEVLRTRYEMVEGIAQQRVELECGVGVVVEDLRAVGAEEREQEMRRRAGEEARRPFDLKRAPMLRARLLRMGEEEHVLLLTMHHIASDGWSIGVLVREAVALYEAYVEGRPSPLEELKIQYGDYAVWQREWLKGEVLEKQLGYWREQLADLPVLELPTDHVRPAVPSRAGGTETVEISAELTGRLRELCRSEGVTLFMVLLGALQVVLGRWAGQDDVVVGTSIANRTRGELEELIGFFVNQLVLRTSLGGNPSFREVLRRVREVCLGAYTHQDLPFEKLVEELAPERDASRNPLFQVMFVLQNTPEEGSLQMTGLDVIPIPLKSSMAKMDLTLTMATSESQLRANLGYSTDLFEAATVRRMLQHLERVVEEMVKDPESRIGEADLLGAQERQKVLSQWSRPETFVPIDEQDPTSLIDQVERMTAEQIANLLGL